MPPRAAKRKKTNVPSDYGERHDLPTRSVDESEAERRACFVRAWAQHHARKEAEKRGEEFLPEWLKKQRAASNPVFRKAAQASTPKPTGHAAAVARALNEPSSDEEDADEGPRQEGAVAGNGSES